MAKKGKNEEYDFSKDSWLPGEGEEGRIDWLLAHLAKEDAQNGRAEKTYEEDMDRLEEAMTDKLDIVESLEEKQYEEGEKERTVEWRMAMEEVLQAKKKCQDREVGQIEMALRCAVHPDTLRLHNATIEDDLRGAQAKWYKEVGLKRVEECRALMEMFIKWHHDHPSEDGPSLMPRSEQVGDGIDITELSGDERRDGYLSFGITGSKKTTTERIEKMADLFIPDDDEDED
jgi:hypothetical protein